MSESLTLNFGGRKFSGLTSDAARKWDQRLLLEHPPYVRDQDLRSLPGGQVCLCWCNSYPLWHSVLNQPKVLKD